MIEEIYNILVEKHAKELEEETLMELITIDLEPEVTYTLLLTAEAARISFNDYINQILKEYIDNVL